MTKPRTKPKYKFLAFIVEPTPGFNPRNWQQTPEHYRIVEYMGPQPFKGAIDAWKFLHNHKAIALGTTNRWAIYLDFENATIQQNHSKDRSIFNGLPLAYVE